MPVGRGFHVGSHGGFHLSPRRDDFSKEDSSSPSGWLTSLSAIILATERSFCNCSIALPTSILTLVVASPDPWSVFRSSFSFWISAKLIGICDYCFGLTIAVSYTHLRAHETRHDLVC